MTACRLILPNVLLLTAVLAGVSPSARAQQWVPPRQQHAWGSFPVGSWKRVRVTTTEYSSEGKVASESTTTTRSELEAADDEGFTLRVEVTVEVAGKRFEAQPKRVHQTFSSFPNASSRGEMQRITIDNQAIAVEVHRWKTLSGGTQLSHTLHLAPGCPPYVLKRHTKVTAVDQELAQSETWVDVTELEATAQVLGEKKRVWRVRTIHEHDEERSKIEEVHCAEVPGGVVSHKAEHHNKQGVLDQTSRLELVDYHVPPSSATSAARGLFFPRFRRRGSP